MDTLEAIRTRRAVRAYDPAHRLSAAEQRELLELAMLSPTAFNLQHWRFVVVEDAELRRQIRAVAWDQAQVTDASLLVLLCADLASWEKQAAGSGRTRRRRCRTPCCRPSTGSSATSRRTSATRRCAAAASPRRP